MVAFILLNTNKGISRLIIISAYLLRIISLFLFTYIAFNVYDGKLDAIKYYKASSKMNDLFWKNPKSAVEIIFSSPKKVNPEEKSEIRGLWIRYNSAAGFVSKITSITSIFLFDSYFLIAFLYSNLAFLGLWLFVGGFYKRLELIRPLTSLIFLFPSISIWTSNISKDALALFFFGLLVFCLNKLNNKTLLHITLIIISGYFLFRIKSYIFASVAVAYLVSYIVTLKVPISEGLTKNVIRFLVMMVAVFGAYYAYEIVNLESRSIGKINPAVIEELTENLEQGAEIGGSPYIIRGLQSRSGITPMSVLGAIEVTYLRPYITELTRARYLPSFIESFLTLILLISLLIRSRFLTRFKRPVIQDRKLFFLAIFVLVFGTIAGLFSFTYGALIRYKIPGLIAIWTLLSILFISSGKRSLYNL